MYVDTWPMSQVCFDDTPANVTVWGVEGMYDEQAQCHCAHS